MGASGAWPFDAYDLALGYVEKQDWAKSGQNKDNKGPVDAVSTLVQ